MLAVAAEALQQLQVPVVVVAAAVVVSQVDEQDLKDQRDGKSFLKAPVVIDVLHSSVATVGEAQQACQTMMAPTVPKAGTLGESYDIPETSEAFEVGACQDEVGIPELMASAAAEVAYDLYS